MLIMCYGARGCRDSDDLKINIAANIQETAEHAGGRVIKGAVALYLAPLFFVVRLAISLSWRPKLIVPSTLQSILKKASCF
jgi:hypothetical protein